MSVLTKKFGQRLRSIRKQKGITQLELAHEAKLDLTTVNELENGSREPMLKTIHRLSEALSIRMTQLVDF